jgi:hypothetical protein
MDTLLYALLSVGMAVWSAGLVAGALLMAWNEDTNNRGKRPWRG